MNRSKTPVLNLGIKSVRVLLNGTLVGTIAQVDNGAYAFEYADSWITDGFSISPLSLPLERQVFVPKSRHADGLFGVFADSLPDGWGRLLVDRTLSKHGIDPNEVSPLVRLSIVGKNGMGALEYQPESYIEAAITKANLDEIAVECTTLLKTNQADNLDALFRLGGSSGGARPKILTSIDGEDWIVKFPSSVDPKTIGWEEYQIALLAKSCGIDMPEVRLFSSENCPGYFGVKRFDRVASNGKEVNRIHMISVAALLETTHRIPNLDYETLMKLTWMLTDDISQVEKLYKLMCFNVFVGNRDDHSKNFSFLYCEETQRWMLSPAYDLTRNSGMNGEHAMMINGKGRSVDISDLMAVGVGAGIRECVARAVAEEIHDKVAASEFGTPN